jgi:hypothetical protein
LPASIVWPEQVASQERLVSFQFGHTSNFYWAERASIQFLMPEQRPSHWRFVFVADNIDHHLINAS